MRSKISKLLFVNIFIFICINLSPKIIVENYGNWRNLSFSVKGAYITGVWDSLLIELEEAQANQKQDSDPLSCLLKKDLTIGNFVERIDLLYTTPKYKKLSPVTLLKEKILASICSNYQ